jgi:hypothetical protein
MGTAKSSSICLITKCSFFDAMILRFLPYLWVRVRIVPLFCAYLGLGWDEQLLREQAARAEAEAANKAKDRILATLKIKEVWVI